MEWNERVRSVLSKIRGITSLPPRCAIKIFPFAQFVRSFAPQPLLGLLNLLRLTRRISKTQCTAEDSHRGYTADETQTKNIARTSLEAFSSTSQKRVKSAGEEGSTKSALLSLAIDETSRRVGARRRPPVIMKWKHPPTTTERPLRRETREKRRWNNTSNPSRSMRRSRHPL